ncbi:MAG: TfoX/Sxy family protein [Stappiaceae bacterium]
MAYDEELSARFRDCLEGIVGLSEKKMMGGVCFMLDGNMIGGADRQKNGQGRFMFRVGKDNHDQALARPGAIAMEQGGRRMSGFIFVHEEDCDTATLKSWISLAMSFVTTLPPKKK